MPGAKILLVLVLVLRILHFEFSVRRSLCSIPINTTTNLDTIAETSTDLGGPGSLFPNAILGVPINRSKFLGIPLFGSCLDYILLSCVPRILAGTTVPDSRYIL